MKNITLIILLLLGANCLGQVKSTVTPPRIYDCQEGSYYYFHGGQLESARDIKKVIEQRPWRATGQLYTNGNRSGTAIYLGGGLVLTAAHCLGSPETAPTSLSFALAQYGPGVNCNPYGKIPVKRMYVPKEWRNNIGGDWNSTATRAYDYALLELAYEPKQEEGFPEPVGWKVGSWDFESVQRLRPQAIGYSTCQGAPGDPKYMPIESNTTRSVIRKLEKKNGNGGILIMKLEACAGMSGGPVFVEQIVKGRRGRSRTAYKLIGVMVGSTQEACERGHIWAAAITDELRKRITAVKSFLDTPKRSKNSSEYRIVQQRMNIHLFNRNDYVREAGKCDAYLR